MNNNPVYFLVRYYADHFTCYAQGLSVLNIPDLCKFNIIRFYPLPTKNLTHRIVRLQRIWRARRAHWKWCSSPKQLFYRENYGQFPAYKLRNSN
jgi:hypothetical protein